MNITFRQLRLFLALAETGSVSAAAKVMHVTQPTASMQLKDMAVAVGLPLYELVGKKAVPDPSGPRAGADCPRRRADLGCL